MSSPITVTELPKDIDELLRKRYKGNWEGFLQFGESRYILPRCYRGHEAAMRAMPLRPDDVWVATFPRCGTTWTQELVWLLNNDLDYKKAAEINLPTRFFFIDFYPFLHEQLPQLHALKLDNPDFESLTMPGYTYAATMPSPRFLKTHLPLSLLPPTLLDTSKMVYVARDPRDTAVSFYYLSQQFKCFDYVGDFKSYWDLFHKDLITWSPFWAHVKEAWAQRHHPNMLFLFYEDMIQDLPAVVKKVCKFFEKEYSEAQIRTLCDHLDFKNFKNNASVNIDFMAGTPLINKNSEAFIRQGKSGGWRAHFDDEMTRQAEQWMRRHLSDTDLRFPRA